MKIASATKADETNAALELAKADMGKVEEEPKAEEKDPNPSKPQYWYILSAELIDG